MKGHTLIELLVVTSIILVLTLIMLPWAIGRVDVANANKTVAIIREIRRAYTYYRLDTGSNPPWFHLTNENPFLVDPGVAGWRGPYSTERSIPRSHPWKGAIGWDGEGGDCIFGSPPPTCPDRDNNGSTDFIIILDDDRPGTAPDNNEGKIHRRALVRMDRALDDGDLSTGSVQGNAEGDFDGKRQTEVGELAIWIF